ncbi:hypothetical protein HIM_05744 [Hirsutella minnesotensis 3608]|uniref:Uncharacterized protein n=1 Tax=Hirsutella minnesotensis 3608 TaxID=1043627 RepID=A0A0F7ZP40_9HYPO|nr:hypothetical protein HIM_05744 [Hirsutella minnesotensis 3608]
MEPGINNNITRKSEQLISVLMIPETTLDGKTGSTRPELEARLVEEVRLRRFTEDVLDSRQEELEQQEMENRRLSKTIETLQRELAEAQRQLNEARSHTKAKTKQLQDAKDHIFRLQPRRKDITETEAQDAYKKLCSNVQRWVENRLPPILDEMESGRLRNRPSSSQAARFASLIREPARHCLSAHLSDEHHVISVIMYYLWLAFFSKSFYCPLDSSDDDATLMWIDELESTMEKLPRDHAHCREWRSETLTALSSQPLFKTRQAAYIKLVSDDLASILSLVVPRAALVDLQSSVRRTLVEPAADFAHKLQLATNIFSLKWPARNASTRLEVYECINLASGGLVLDLSSPGSKASSRKVKYLFDVAPGLFVERVEVGKKGPLKAIYRPNVLVYSGDGEVPQRPTLMKWVCDGASTSSRDMPPRAAVPRSKSIPCFDDVLSDSDDAATQDLLHSCRRPKEGDCDGPRPWE